MSRVNRYPAMQRTIWLWLQARRTLPNSADCATELYCNPVLGRSQCVSVYLPHPGVALPLDLCHFADNNIDPEWPALTDLPFLHRNRVMTGCQRNAKSTLIISSEGCDYPFLVFHDESRVRQGGGIRNVLSCRPGMNWTNRNHTLNPCPGFGRHLPRRKNNRHNKEHQSYAGSSQLHKFY
jgi:hypothetical protein